MEEIKKTIILDNIDLVSAFGQNESFFNQIESRFDSTVVLRGNTLFTKGSKDELESIEKIINELSFLLKKDLANDCNGGSQPSSHPGTDE